MLRKVDRKFLESFEMWCRRRMEKVRWTDLVKNEALYRGRDEILTGVITVVTT
jgi:hypothetical protein